jgi:hypothetical protein
LSDETLVNPTFTAPEITHRTPYAQDIYGPALQSTVSAIQVPHALNKCLDIAYLGAFRVASQASGNSNWNSSNATAVITYNPENDSLFMAGHETSNIIAEFAIPASLSTGSTVASIVNAATIQDYVTVLNKNTVTGNSDRINGIMPYNGTLFVTSENFYDNSGNQHNLQVFTDADNLASGGNKGFLKLSGASHVAGWMSELPAEQKAILGADYVAGWSRNYSITERYSQGPSLFAFSPQDAIDVDLNSGEYIQTTKLIDYPSANPLTEKYNAINEPSDPIWGHFAKVNGAAMIKGSPYFLALGAHGGVDAGIGYKITQDDGNVCGGYCPFLVADKDNYFWLFDVNDAISATNPHDVRPFAFGRWSHPFDSNGKYAVAGSAYDAVNDRLFVALDYIGKVGTYNYDPLILVYSLSAKVAEDDAILADTAEMIFELETTNQAGLKSKDTVSVMLDSGAVVVEPDPDPEPDPEPVPDFSVGQSPTTIGNNMINSAVNLGPTLAAQAAAIDGNVDAKTTAVTANVDVKTTAVTANVDAKTTAITANVDAKTTAVTANVDAQTAAAVVSIDAAIETAKAEILAQSKSPIKSIQRGVTTPQTTSQSGWVDTVTIAAVDMSKTVVNCVVKDGYTNTGNSVGGYAYLASETAISVGRSPTDSGTQLNGVATVYWEVIEYV